MGHRFDPWCANRVLPEPGCFWKSLLGLKKKKKKKNQLENISTKTQVFFFLYKVSYHLFLKSVFFFFPVIFISWRLITLQYCSGFCHTLIWISHGFTCISHPDTPSHLPPHPIPLGLPSAPAPSTCFMHPTWADETGAHYTEWSKPERCNCKREFSCRMCFYAFL